ncbi:Hypothetical predicted protein [Podarcis lilfordi]|uniref:GRAM domain-containing protein n=1 Tax=Podarcis lilfordi TaxID=74358 RepID=A0AA35LMM8_9SAUR|nr:Hypothetical predicted protein [Podarcis lilfordi]
MVKLGVAPGPDSLSLTDISCLSEVSGKPRKSKRRMSEQKKSQSLEETVGEAARNGHNPPLSRSKTYDPSYSKEAEKETLASAQHRKLDSNLVKHALNFRRVFKDFPEEEDLLQTFSCAWQREVPYHGRLYISENHVCFYCSMVHREVKVVIPVPSISILKKANTALLVPNAVCIRTSDGEKFLFGSLRSRETVYQVLRSICKHLQDGSRNNSPTTAQNLSDQLLKISLTPKELDGSRTPPLDETLPEEPDGADKSQSPPTAAIEPHWAAANRGGVRSTKSWRSWKAHLSPLNTVILIYLCLVVVLLLSSGYIGLRIVQLEEQLISMGAWPEIDLQQHQYKTT